MTPIVGGRLVEARRQRPPVDGERRFVARRPLGDRARASDRQLATAVIAGDHAALEDICTRYRARLHAFVRRVVPGGPFEEIVQDVFLSLWAAPTRFDPGRGSLSTFLHVTAKGKAIDWVRSEARRREREGHFGRVVVELHERARGGDLGLTVRAAVDSLPRNEQRAIWLAYYMGYTYRQVAAILNVPEGTAKAYLRTALGRLHTLLDHESGGADVARPAV